eukprot:295495-Chlamydomonas_euryale.AAC.1
MVKQWRCIRVSASAAARPTAGDLSLNLSRRTSARPCLVRACGSAERGGLNRGWILCGTCRPIGTGGGESLHESLCVGRAGQSDSAGYASN